MSCFTPEQEANSRPSFTSQSSEKLKIWSISGCWRAEYYWSEPTGTYFPTKSCRFCHISPLLDTRGYFKALTHVLVTSWHRVTSAQSQGPGMSGISAVDGQCPGPGNVGRPGRCLLSAIVFTHSSIKVSQLSPYITSSQGPVWLLIGQCLTVQASDWLLWPSSPLVSHQRVRGTDPSLWMSLDTISMSTLGQILILKTIGFIPRTPLGIQTLHSVLSQFQGRADGESVSQSVGQ